MKVRNRAIWQAGLIGALVAAVANVAVYAVGSAAGVDFVAPGTQGQALGVGPVASLSILPMVTGTAFAALLNRWGRLRVAQLVGAIVAVVSVAVVPLPGFDAASQVLLAAMHLIAGAVYVLALERTRRGAPAAGDAAAARAGRRGQAGSGT